MVKVHVLALFVIGESNAFVTSPWIKTFPRHNISLNNRGGRLEQEEKLFENVETEEEEVYGAKFFGGNQVKEELFDAEVEGKADTLFSEASVVSSYSRFEDTKAFPDPLAKSIAIKLQYEINQLIGGGVLDNAGSVYGVSKIEWDSSFYKSKESATPLQELTIALEYYNRVDIAVLSGKKLPDNQVELRWSVSVMWPNMWEARVAFSGTSVLTLSDDDEPVIVKQMDRLDDDADVLKVASNQFFPSFWDIYNIAMSPAAEEMQRLKPSDGKTPGLFSSYKVFDIAPRMVLKPSLIDTDGREGRNAQILPMHSFSTIIKTTGPQIQTYVTTSPIEVSIKPMSSEDGMKKSCITWTVPVAISVASKPELPLPVENDDKLACVYELQERRCIATLPFSGEPQDEEVTKMRQQLFEAVQKDGLIPKLDESGRPIFLFLQNEAKACFVEDGLGMAIYEDRPSFTKSNEVGLELEIK